MNESNNPNNQPVSTVILWAIRGLFILALCLIIWKSVESAGPARSIPHLDKALHFVAYAVLCYLALQAKLFKNAVVAVIAVIAIGLCMEVLQGVMGVGRTASIADFIANSCGAVTSFLIWQRLKFLNA